MNTKHTLPKNEMVDKAGHDWRTANFTKQSRKASSSIFAFRSRGKLTPLTSITPEPNYLEAVKRKGHMWSATKAGPYVKQSRLSRPGFCFRGVSRSQHALAVTGNTSLLKDVRYTKFDESPDWNNRPPTPSLCQTCSFGGDNSLDNGFRG